MRKVLCENCVIYGTNCAADVPQDKLERFHATSVSAIYKRRQVVFHEGTPANGVYILCHGAVKLYQSDRFGRDYILGITGPGEVIGELPLDPLETYSVSAEALTDAQLCFLSRDRLIPFIEECPMIGVRLIAALSRCLSKAHRKVRSLALKNAESRLADLLLQLAGVSSEPGKTKPTRAALHYSRRELAEMIGVSTETVIRLLGRLKEKQALATQQRELILTDIDKLRRLANVDTADAE